MGCQTTIPMTEFDIITTDDTTQMMKAIIPYIGFPLQKSMAIMIRLKELQDTIRCYNSSQCMFLNKASGNSNDMFEALCRYCPPDIAANINTIRQMSQFSDIMKMYNDLEQSVSNVMNDAASQDTNESQAQGTNESQDNTKDNTDNTGNTWNMNNINNMNDMEQNPQLKNIMNMMNDTDSLMDDSQRSLYNEYLEQLDDIIAKSEQAED